MVNPPNSRDETAPRTSGGDSDVKGRFSWLTVAVGVVAFGLTLVSFDSTKRAAREADLNHFRNLTHQLSSGFDERLRSTASALRTGAVMVTQADGIDRQTWVEFLAATGLDSENGMVGLGYVERVPRREVEAFERRIRATGLPDYTAERAGDHDPLFLVAYIEPVADNADALGIDIANGITRRTAAETAMRENRVTMSRRIRIIVGERETPGFLLFSPVFPRGAAIETPAQREANLMGWVYAAVRVDALVAPLEEQYLREISFTVHEGGASETGRILWDSLDRDLQNQLQGEEEVEVFGQTWTVRTYPRPALLRAPAHQYAWTVLWLGSLGSLGAIMLTLRLTDSRLRAWRAVGKRRRGRGRAGGPTALGFEASPVGLRLREYDQDQELLVNPAYSRLTGIPAGTGSRSQQLSPPAPCRGCAQMESDGNASMPGSPTGSTELRFIRGRPHGLGQYLLRRFDDVESNFPPGGGGDDRHHGTQATGGGPHSSQRRPPNKPVWPEPVPRHDEPRNPAAMNGVIGMASLLETS